MNFLQKIKGLSGVITLSFITSILYYCGYLSSEYHNKVLGVFIDYSPIEYLKWGGDFFIYSFVDFLANLNILLLPIPLDIFIHAGIILLVLSLFFKYRVKLNYPYYIGLIILTYSALVVVFSIFHLRIFVSNDFSKYSIDYSFFSDFWLLFKKYWIFLGSNILAWGLIILNWESMVTWMKNLSVFFAILSFMLLPCLYGVYGRGYEYPFMEDKRALLIGEDKDDYYLVLLREDGTTGYVRKYEIVAKGDLNIEYQSSFNFFDFISSTVDQ